MFSYGSYLDKARQDKNVSSEISVSSLIGKDDLHNKTTLERVAEVITSISLFTFVKTFGSKRTRNSTGRSA